MLYYLFELLEKKFQFPGATLFNFLSFRASLAIILSSAFTLIYGRVIIRFLKVKQIGESIRDLGLAGQNEKEGTPCWASVKTLANDMGCSSRSVHRIQNKAVKLGFLEVKNRSKNNRRHFMA